MDFKKVVVAGSGVLGSQIALQTAFKGFDVTIWLRSEGSIDRAKPKLERFKNIYLQTLEAMKTNPQAYCRGLSDKKDLTDDKIDELKDNLIKGYDNLTLCHNGQEAWDFISDAKAGKVPLDIDCVITDLEMPLMDGHRLTKLIKSDDKLKNIPVVIFSSLINEQMRAKGESLGADVQLSKPEIGLLVSEIDKLLR